MGERVLYIPRVDQDWGWNTHQRLVRVGVGWKGWYRKMCVWCVCVCFGSSGPVSRRFLKANASKMCRFRKLPYLVKCFFWKELRTRVRTHIT